MKKFILTTILLILIPLVILSIFTTKNDMKFKYGSNLTIKVKRVNKGTIDEVPFEEYIIGVVSGEMPLSFNIEALKAQAVAARSYAFKRMNDNYENEYHVVDTTQNQVYLDDSDLRNRWGETYNQNIEKVRKAINQTMGEYLTYNGEIIDAFFFSTSTGVTENSGEVFSQQLPYLVSVSSTFEEGVSPVYNDSVEMTLSTFYANLNLPFDNNLNIEIIETTSTNRIKRIKINGIIFTGTEISNILGLRSNYFSITRNGDLVNIDTKGYGHGVGMSQYGAEAMAQNGYKYDEILKYYYTGVELKKF